MTTIERVREEKMNEGAIIFCVPVSDETAASIETESTTIRIGRVALTVKLLRMRGATSRAAMLQSLLHLWIMQLTVVMVIVMIIMAVMMTVAA